MYKIKKQEKLQLNSWYGDLWRGFCAGWHAL